MKLRRRDDQLFYGDNLNGLRDHNLQFKSPVAANVSSLKKKTGQSGLTSAATENYSSAQIAAFEDSWHWNPQAEREFDELLTSRIPTRRRRN